MSQFVKRTPPACLHTFRRLVTVLAVVLLLLSLRGGSSAGTSTDDDGVIPGEKDTTLSLDSAATAVSRIVSLQAACHSELKMYCNHHPVSPLHCLVEQYERTVKTSVKGASTPTSMLYSDVCASWLAARDACLSFVHERAHELCDSATHDARECLRRIPPLVLPHACVTSAYYESVRLVGKLRQHQAAGARLRQLRVA